MTDFTREGFRAAPTHDERVYEAMSLFNEGRTGADAFAQARLIEAFTTQDFRALLSDGLESTAVQAQAQKVREFENILVDSVVDDFEPHKLIDIWADAAFLDVAEGEEYKEASAKETSLTQKANKTGRKYGLTFEKRRSRKFSELANFPLWLANGAVSGENNKVANVLVKNSAWNPDFFGTVDNKPLTPENLDAAIKALAMTKNHRDEYVSTTSLVLAVAPALQTEARRILNASEVELQVTNGSKVTKTRIPNPFAGVVELLVSETLGNSLGENQGTAWALLQGKGSNLPSIIRTKLSGEENVDLRVQNAAGQYVSGAQVPVDEGSFKDDTIWYRGRLIFGIDAAFKQGVYASAGK